MAVYAIADLHLSHAVEKPMEKFGSRWADHPDKIRRRWCALVEPKDTVVLPGDFSWAMNLDEAEADFRFLASLPGKKLLGKGNHDYWWTSVSKMKTVLAGWGISDVDFLHNSAAEADGMILCGTRGWFYDEKTQAIPADYEKLVSREAARAEHSLAAGDVLRGERTMPSVLFLHFPPVWGDFVCRPLLDAIHAHGVTEVYFGHIHGRYDLPPKTEFEGISLNLISADYLNFIPQKVW